MRLHSEYSLVDGLVRIKPLAKQAAELGMPAVALTDFNNFFGAVKFYKATQAAGVKPIIGADLLVLDESGEGNANPDCCCWSKTRLAMPILTKLISKAYQQGQRQGVPYIKKSWLGEFSEGLIALSGGRCGEVGVALVSGRRADAVVALEEFVAMFGDRFYLEIAAHGACRRGRLSARGSGTCCAAQLSGCGDQ